MFKSGRTEKSSEEQVAPAERAGKGEVTRQKILDTAVGLFRERGFDETTMREVASQAGVALGLTYHYFPSKEAVVMAYYDRVQGEHRRVVEDKVLAVPGLRDRLAQLFHTKLDIVKDDRRLLGALFRYTGNPEHPLSFLGKGTEAIREDCISLFAEALEREPLPDDLRVLLPKAIWALHMGVLLYFLYDTSEGQARTRRLVDGSMDLTVSLLKLVKLPLLAPVLGPVRRSVLGLLREVELV